MANREPFATVTELEAYWHNFTDSEKPRAEALLKSASDRLRLMARGNDVDLDEKITDDEVFKANLQIIVMESVKRAMQAPQDLPPVDQFQQAAGPYSQNIKYSNPTGDLYFKKSELALIGVSGGQKLSSISTSRRDIYGD